MLQKTIKRIGTILLAVCTAATFAVGQEYSAFLGKWGMTSETNGDPVKWTLVVREDSGKIAALLSTGEGEGAAKDVSYKEGVLKFKAPYKDAYYDIELKSTGTKLEGTWSGGGDSGKTFGTKAP